MSIEQQVTGGRVAGKVGGCVFIDVGQGDQEQVVTISYGVEGHGSFCAQLILPVSEARKIEKGDNVCVNVEITREP